MSSRAPPQSVLVRWYPWVRLFVRVAFAIWQRRPFSVTSWYRDPETNAATPGSSPNSQHLIGTAADVVPDDGDLEALAELAQRFGIVAVVYRHHVHLQLFRAGNRPE